MESIGEKLKVARESKGISIEQVARETNIAKRFIHALELEDFTVFPGEPYLIGFLRNYADYVGLDSREIITLYKNMKIQEQPVPMDELLDAKPSIPWGGIALGVVAVGLIVAAIIFVPALIPRGDASPSPQPATEDETTSALSELTIDSDVDEYFGERAVITVTRDGVDPTNLEVAAIGKVVSLDYPGGTLNLRLGEGGVVDMDSNGLGDLGVDVQDIIIDGNDRRVRLKLTYRDEAADAEMESLGSTTIEDREQTPEVILTKDVAGPFRMDVTFRGYSLVRTLIDGEIREERYFNKDDTTRIEANNEVQLWVSNADSFRAKIEQQDVILGRPGEVATKLIRWRRNAETRKYELTLVPVY